MKRITGAVNTIQRGLKCRDAHLVLVDPQQIADLSLNVLNVIFHLNPVAHTDIPVAYTPSTLLRHLLRLLSSTVGSLWEAAYKRSVNFELPLLLEVLVELTDLDSHADVATEV